MNPSQTCIASLRRLCAEHDPSLGIALDLLLELTEQRGSASAGDGGFTGQIDTLNDGNPPGDSHHASRAESSPGRVDEEDYDRGVGDFGWGLTIEDRRLLPPDAVIGPLPSGCVLQVPNEIDEPCGPDRTVQQEGSAPVPVGELWPGVKIVTDPSLPPGVVELRQDGRILGSITNLADPTKAIREAKCPRLWESWRAANRPPDAPAEAVQQPNDLPPPPPEEPPAPEDPSAPGPPQVDEEDEWEIPPRAHELPRAEKAALCARLRRHGMSHGAISKKTGIPLGSIAGLIAHHKEEKPSTREPTKDEAPKRDRPSMLPGYVAHAHVRKVFDEALARCYGAPRGESVVEILRLGMVRPAAPTKMADELELPATTVATVLNRYKPLLKAWRAFVSPTVRAYFGELVQEEVGRRPLPPLLPPPPLPALRVGRRRLHGGGPRWSAALP